MTRSPSPDAPPKTSPMKPTLTFSTTVPSHTQSLSLRLHDRLQGEGIPIDDISKINILPNLDSNGTRTRSPLINAKVPFSVCLFHTFGLIEIRPQLKMESLS
jgi:hypothetical protein